MKFDFNHVIQTSKEEIFGIDSLTEAAAKEPCVWQTEKIAKRELTRARDGGFNYGMLSASFALALGGGISCLYDYLHNRKKKDD